MILPLGALHLEETPRLQWSWRVERPLAIRDEREPGSDDFAARVCVLTGFERERATLGERMEHAVKSRLARQEVPSHSLCYVFSSRLPVGTTWKHARSGGTRIEVRATGAGPAAGDGRDAGRWRHESVDIVRDYRHALEGEGMPRVIALALMTDSDDRCLDATAWFADFRFAPPELEVPVPQPGSARPLHPPRAAP